ncbi:MAG TPA: glycosyltransferase [Longimicrobiales bacterium]|nr:glycosyltransferase [Longimicrobiales bacterium]
MLYFGPAREHSTSLQRATALSALGCDVRLVDSREAFDLYGPGGWRMRVEVRMGRGRTFRDAGRLLVQRARDLEPDVVWLDAGYLVPARAVAELRRLRNRPLVVHYTPDSLWSPGMGHAGHRATLRACDVAVTTKRREVRTYRNLGVPRVVFSWQGYDPEVHRPPNPAPEGDDSMCFVGFVGQYHRERARLLERIARGVRCRVVALGPGWPGRGRPGIEVGGPVWGEAYARALATAALPLVLLNDRVRDEYTTRTLEIPACGKPLIAPRTRVHGRLFRDAVHGRLFRAEEELLDIVRKLLPDRARREEMGAAARRRVEELNLTWAGVLRRVLARLEILP